RHISFKDGYSTDLSLSMPGLVQAQNCALALLVLRTLGLYRQGATEKALEKNALPGRMERISWKRTLYLDGAHTQNSMGHLLETFRAMFPGRMESASSVLSQARTTMPCATKYFRPLTTSWSAGPGHSRKATPRPFMIFLCPRSARTRRPC
ncbi:MAG: hypothetical protein IKO96_02570, partial [Spirochaetales bacterium]|nr:hypothetical protein [Spirochaetales bacterium]